MSSNTISARFYYFFLNLDSLNTFILVIPTYLILIILIAISYKKLICFLTTTHSKGSNRHPEVLPTSLITSCISFQND